MQNLEWLLLAQQNQLRGCVKDQKDEQSVPHSQLAHPFSLAQRVSQQ